MTAVRLKVTTDTFHKSTMSDEIVEAFETLGVRVTTKCKFQDEQPHMIVTLLNITEEMLQLLFTIEKCKLAPLMYKEKMFVLRFNSKTT